MEKAKQLQTKEGIERLEKELYERENVTRPEIAEKIKEARSQGDLSENAEYDAARDAQRENETRINQLKEILANSEIVDVNDYNEDEVGLGKTILIKNCEDGKERTVKMVGATDADIYQNKISNECPVGMAIFKRKVGEIVDVNLPNGNVVKYEILSIEKTEEE